MIRVFAAVVAAVVAQSVTFSPTQPHQPTAQCDFQPQAPNAPVIGGCIDWVDPAAGIIAGWGLDFHTGQVPKGLFLMRLSSPGGSIPFTVIPVARPDVAAALGVANQDLGFGLLTGPLAPGTYSLIDADFPYAWACVPLPTGGIGCDYVASEVVFTVQP